MAETRTCPQCGASLSSDAPLAPCPACLMKLGLESWEHRNSIAATIDSPAPDSAGQRFVPPKPVELERLFPQLEILDLLGHGGMGAVYKARQKSLDRLVALKIIKPNVAHDPGFAGRFMREARTLARLNHPRIVAVFDYGETAQAGSLTGTVGSEKLYFFIMEYVDGRNLRRLMESRELSAEQALAIIPQVCEALQVAHDEGIVHRDIKPENILLDSRGRVKIADFGLAKLRGSDAVENHTLTGTHQVMGTPRYMAPEQMEGTKSVDHRADIYSLGVVFYELLTGELPMGRFAPPSSKAQVDGRLDEIVLRTLEKEVERRYQRASEVKSDVESVTNSPVQPRTRQDGSLPRPSDRPDQLTGLLVSHKPHYGLLAMGGVMLLLGLMLFGVSTKPDASYFLWIALGMAISGAGCFAAAWREEQRLPPDAKVDPGMLAMGVAMVLVGVVLVVYGASTHRFGPFTLIWVGMGIVMSGGGCLVAAWQGEDEDEDEEAPDAKAPPQIVARKPLGAVASADALRQVQGPAVGLIIAGCFDLLLAVILLAAVVLPWISLHSESRPGLVGGGAVPGVSVVGSLVVAQAGAPPLESIALAPLALIATLTFLSLPIGILSIVAGIKMREAELYGLAVVASLLTAVPCHAGWMIGTPIGIWSLWVLTRPEVRAAFASHALKP